MILILSYYFMKVLGLVTFNIKINQFDKKTYITKIPSFSHSLLGCTYNIVLIVTFIISCFFIVPDIFYVKFQHVSSSIKVIYIFKMIVGISVLLLVWIFECFQYQRIKVVHEIFNLNVIITEMYNIFSLQSIKYKTIICFLINWFIWIFLITLDYLAFTERFNSSLLPVLLSNFICSWILLRFALGISVLKTQYQSINKALGRFSKKFIYSSGLIMSDIRINQIQIKYLLNIKRAHEFLFVLSRNMRKCHEFQLFIVIMLFSGNIVYSSFYFVQMILNSKKKLTLYRFFDSCIYLISESFPIIIMTTSVTELTHQIQITSNILHQVMDESIYSHEMKLQLRQFSLQLLHRNKMYINLYNFIPLDNSFLQIIVSTVTTYLIVLLEFDNKPRT